MLLDGFLPHAHELPALELLEEAEILDVVVRVTLDEPLAERHELDRGVLVLIEGEALARDGVVLVTTFFVAGGLEVIRV